MTDREIIVHLAEKVMGWPIIRVSRVPITWNPLESIADAFEVQAKVLEGPHAKTYVLRIYDAVRDGMLVIGTQRLYKSLLAATPRQRCLAAVEATR